MDIPAALITVETRVLCSLSSDGEIHLTVAASAEYFPGKSCSIEISQSELPPGLVEAVRDLLLLVKEGAEANPLIVSRIQEAIAVNIMVARRLGEIP